MKEIFFLIEEAEEGGYIASAIGQSIITEANTLNELKANIREATICHFEVFNEFEWKLEPVTPLLERFVKQFRLRPDQATKVLEMHSVETINRQLYEIHTKVNDGKVKNLGSYTAKVFGLETTNAKIDK